MSAFAFRQPAGSLSGDEVGHVAEVEVAEGVVIRDRITAIAHGRELPSGGRDVAATLGSVIADGFAAGIGAPSRFTYIAFENIAPLGRLGFTPGTGFLVPSDRVVRFV